MSYFNHYSKWHNHKDLNYINYMKRKFSRAFGDFLPEEKDAAILELGCANGMALYALQDMGYTNLLGIEIDKELAQIAQSFSLPVVIKDATLFIKETKKKFDFIYMFDVIEHFEPVKIPHILKSLFELLNENGKLMMITPNATSPAGSYFRYIDWTHQTSFTPTSMSYLLEVAGFMEITISEESLIEVPVEEDFDNSESYYYAFKISEKARFYESFARWQMASMFGSSPYNMLVTPNMKVIATKKNVEKVDLKLNFNNDELFDLQDLANQVSTNALQLEEFKNRFTIKQDDLAKQVSTNRMQIEEFKNRLTIKQEELSKNLNILKREIPKFINTNSKFHNRLESIILILYKKASKKRKNLFWRILFKLKSLRIRKHIINSGYFDEEYYLKNNSDVRDNGIDPVLHYLMYGAYEGRNPSKDFDTNTYIQNHPEILLDNINPLLHFVMQKGNE